MRSDVLKIRTAWKRQIAGLMCVLGILGALTACKDTQAVSRYDISGELIYSHSLETEYAEGFSVDYYEEGYALITTSDGSRFLVVPEDGEVPGDLSGDICVLQQPVSDIYLVASAVMDMFCAMDAVDAISLSGTAADSWHIEKAREAMEDGAISYAGKYSAPDYELIVASGCRLSIQSTMIEHVPEVKEQLELLGIPVLVDRSSYEEHPLGRSEWIKLYGVLTGREEAAESAFARQQTIFEEGLSEESLGKTVAFFYITSNGAVQVRKSGDYIARMIALAGGTYIFEDLKEDGGASGTRTLQMEEFYAGAKDADYLIYSSAIEGELHSLDELLDKSPLFADFKAVQEKQVWCTTADLYQSSMELGTATADIHKMLTMEGTEDAQLTYLFRLE
jgi:iron complex transport system substrate-binding protein